MKLKAQSLMEFAIILLFVTVISFVSLKIISNRINANPYKDSLNTVEEQDSSLSQEEINCTKMGLSWDKQNGICEAK